MKSNGARDRLSDQNNDNNKIIFVGYFPLPDRVSFIDFFFNLK